MTPQGERPVCAAARLAAPGRRRGPSDRTQPARVRRKASPARAAAVSGRAAGFQPLQPAVTVAARHDRIERQRQNPQHDLLRLRRPVRKSAGAGCLSGPSSDSSTSASTVCARCAAASSSRASRSRQPAEPLRRQPLLRQSRHRLAPAHPLEARIAHCWGRGRTAVHAPPPSRRAAPSQGRAAVGPARCRRPRSAPASRRARTAPSHGRAASAWSRPDRRAYGP